MPLVPRKENEVGEHFYGLCHILNAVKEFAGFRIRGLA